MDSLLALGLVVALVLALRPRRRRPSWVIAELDRKAQQPYVPPELTGPTCHYSADVDPISGSLISEGSATWISRPGWPAGAVFGQVAFERDFSRPQKTRLVGGSACWR